MKRGHLLRKCPLTLSISWFLLSLGLNCFSGQLLKLNDCLFCRKAKPKISFLNIELERTAMPEEVKGRPEAPEVDFEIEHVYGYRASDCQQNL